MPSLSAINTDRHKRRNNSLVRFYRRYSSFRIDSQIGGTLMTSLKMLFTNRFHGNMSFFHGSKRDVADNRFDVAVNDDFSLFSPKGKKIIPHGFAPLLVNSGNILVISESNRKDYDGIGIADKSTVPCDAIIVANCKNFPVVIPNADCYPLVIFDPAKNVFAVAHSSREQTLANIAGECVAVMWMDFGCFPKDIIAYIYPGICADCYLLESLDSKVPAYLEKMVGHTNQGFISVNLRRMIIRQLLKSEIEHVRFPAGRYDCTCHTSKLYGEPLYYSYYGYNHRHRFPGHTDQGNNALFVEMI
jgi:copper oxidase (laccase) domain-containing protein